MPKLSARTIAVGLSLCTLACTEQGTSKSDVTSAIPAVDWQHPSAVLGPFEFTPGSSFDWVTDSTLALIDTEDAVIRRIALSGSELRPIGRKGGGPGEFRAPMLVHARADGALAIVDAQLRRVTYSDANGEIRAEVQVPSIPTQILRFAGNRVELVWGGFMRGDDVPRLGAVDIDADSAWEQQSLLELHPSLQAGSSRGNVMNMLAATASDHVVLLASPWKYEIVALSRDGSTITRYQRPDVQPALPTAEENEAIERRMREQMAKHGIAMREELRQLLERNKQTPKPYFKANALSVDGFGRLWVAAERHNPAGSEFDVFAEAGTFLGTVTIPRKVRGLAFRGESVALLSESTSEDSDGQSILEVFTLR